MLKVKIPIKMSNKSKRKTVDFSFVIFDGCYLFTVVNAS